MSFDKDAWRAFLSQDLLDFCIRLGLILVAIIACERIFAPFIPIMLLGIILAVSIQPLLHGLCARLGWSAGRGATLIVVLGIVLIGVPTVMLGISFATHIFELVGAINSGDMQIPAPAQAVRDWPLLGERVYSAWAQASADTPAFLAGIQPKLASASKMALSAATSTAATLLFFFGALIIAGIMMAYSVSGSNLLERVFTRVTSPAKGPALHRLATLTVRSVAVGVVGVAFIQALLLGMGFMLAGIPAAGLLALLVLVLGILQLPALLVSLPAVAYVWGMGDGGALGNTLLTAYFIIAGFADNVLKPMLLGRGVDVPMPIVLLGALGGMVGAGIIGLFVGAVVLSVSYELFMDWLGEGAGATSPAASPEPAAASE